MRVLAEITGPAVPIVVDGADGVWVHTDESCRYQPDGSWRFSLAGTLVFDTYFGSFPLWKWRKETSLTSLNLRVSGSGRFVFRVAGWTAWGDQVAITRTEIYLKAGEPQTIEIPSLVDMDETISYLVLSCTCVESEGTISCIQYVTTDAPKRDFRLGISITTFNRQQYLIRNMQSIAAALATRPDADSQIEITVVDNGQNVELPAAVASKVRLVPNANLGGAGGFARGLMMYRQEKRVTHVLFMDDDVTICPESIFRAMAFLSFANDDMACIAGAMFEEERPNVQFELGAQWKPFDSNPFKGLQRGMRLDEWRVIRNSENIEHSISYGAWWFYMFPVDVIPDYPLPVFVRGDDVTFGLRGAGEATTTLHGVGVWHQAFMYKNGPFHYFLEARNLPLVGLLATDDYKMRHLLKRTLHFGLRFLLLMRYSTAEAFMAGTREFLKGPKYWLQIDHPERLQFARQFTGETVGQIGSEWDAYQLPPVVVRKTKVLSVDGNSVEDAAEEQSLLVAIKNSLRRSRRVKKLVYFSALGGHLVPKFMSRLPVRTVPSEDMLPWGNFFRETVVYRWRATGEGYVVTRDRGRFFKLFFSLIGLGLAVIFKAPRVIKKYRKAYPEMTSADYWNTQFEKANL